MCFSVRFSLIEARLSSVPAYPRPLTVAARTSSSPSRRADSQADRFGMDEGFQSQWVRPRWVIGLSATAGVSH